MEKVSTWKKIPCTLFKRAIDMIRPFSSTHLTYRVVFAVVLLTTISTGVEAQITLVQNYQNNVSAPIGVFQGINFREAGFSGLYTIPNTDGKEFWTVSDRGVNVDAANANPAACRPTYDKIYGFPNYAPKIHRIRLNGDSIQILQTITMKRPDGTTASGLINPTGFGSTAAEVASTDTVLNCANFTLKTAPKDIWGIDSEGIVVDNDGYFWICEEGGPTIWKLNANGVVVKRFTPYANLSGAQSIDVQIDTVFKYRKNNRGFEGISITPNGKIYAIIQSPLLYPTKSVGEGTRVHRILEIDPATNATRMFAYLNDGIIGASGANQIRLRDWKIGDMAAINNNSFLVMEAALRGTSDIKRIYKIDISGATPVTTGLYGGVTLEALMDAAGLAANGITPVQKTLFMDLLANGWDPVLDKAEGITIINDSTIAIGNDNDFGQFSPAENGVATATTNKSHIYVYGLQGSNKLADYCLLTAEAISGPTNACAYSGHAGDVAIYSIATTDAANFTWKLPAKALLVSGQGTNTITVKYLKAFTSGAISVTVGNACGGSSITRSLTITNAVPSIPAAIEGPPTVCSFVGTGTPVTYSIAPATDAVSYFWKVPEKAMLVSGQGTTSVTVIFSKLYTSGTLKVKAVSGCGSSMDQAMKVDATIPDRPGAISGKVNAICSPADTVTYTIDPVPFATSYIWSTNVSGAIISSDGTTATIIFPPFISGTVQVTAVNECGISAPRSVNVISRPSIPENITGSENVCSGSLQTYSITPIDGITSYNWSVPYGSVIQSGTGTDSITVLMGSTNGIIKVKASNNCGTSTKSLMVTVERCDNAEQIAVYPNPTNGPVNINFHVKEQETYKIYITDILTGKIVFSTTTSSAGENEVSADLTSLPKGLYFVHLVSATEDYYQRLKIE